LQSLSLVLLFIIITIWCKIRIGITINDLVLRQ